MSGQDNWPAAPGPGGPPPGTPMQSGPGAPGPPGYGPPGLQPPPSSSKGDSTTIAIVAAVVIIVLLVGGIGFLVLNGDDGDSGDPDVAADETSDGDDRSADDQPVEQPTLVGIDDVEVGQCFDEPESDDRGNVEELPLVDCSAVHVYEAFNQFELEDGLWPGQESVTDDARSGCDERFEDFVGIPKDDSELEGFFLAPTVVSWDGYDDRTVTCFVTDENEDTTGSLEGAGR